MNEVLLKMRRVNKPIQPESPYLHLFMLIKQISLNSYGLEESASVGGNITIKLAQSGTRMRKVVRRSNYRMTGKFPSFKNARMMHWESKYEQDAFHLLETCPLVKSYSEQPALLRYNDEDEVTHLHYPDILVELTSGHLIFIEIKPETAATDTELAIRTKLLQGLLRAKGYYYLMILPEQVDRLAYLNNAKHLLEFGKIPTPETVWEKVRRIFLTVSNIQIAELIQMIGNVHAKNWIYRMLITGDLTFESSISISKTALVSWPSEGEM